jgi:hypothetical protein
VKNLFVLFVIPKLLFSQISTDSVVFDNNMNHKMRVYQSLNLSLYAQLSSSGEGTGYAGAEYDIKSIHSIGFEVGPALVLNNNDLKIGLNVFVKHVEMDVQTVTAPPRPPPIHEIRNINLFGMTPSYGYDFKISDNFTINPQFGIYLRFSTYVPSVFLSPCVSFYYKKIGILTLFNYNLADSIWADEKYSVFIGIGYLLNINLT